MAAVQEFFPPQAKCARAPKITVAMPVLNGGKHLRLAVLSIVSQTFKDWELLLIDDGSTDNALQGLSIHDCRIRILRDGQNKGLAARLNEAIDLARGEYFARMDHDDVAYPERFEYQLALLESDPELDVVAVRAITISDESDLVGNLPGPITHQDICAKPWKGFYFPHPTWLGHITWFRTHRYTIPGPYFCEDQELLLRSYAQSQFATVDRVLFAYRVQNRIIWKKQTIRRWVLIKFQLGLFVHSLQFRFALLTLLVFAGRLASDLLSVIRQTLGLEHNSYLSKMTDSTYSDEWQAVLNQIRTLDMPRIE